MTDPKLVKLSDFNFYHNERFRYQYDFGAGWVHEIRIEAFLEKNDKYSYPYCLSGQHKAPPEDCGGSLAFMEQRDAAPRHSANGWLSPNAFMQKQIHLLEGSTV